MAKNIYVGVGGKARKVKQLYVGVGGKARKVKKVYVGVGGKARLVWAAATGISFDRFDTGGTTNGGKTAPRIVRVWFNVQPEDASNKIVNAKIVSQTCPDGAGKISIDFTAEEFIRFTWDSTNRDCTANVKVWINDVSCNITLKMYVKPLFINFRYTWSVTQN